MKNMRVYRCNIATIAIKEHKRNPTQKCLRMYPFGSHFCAKY